jgi:hypothetical protein
MVSNLITDLGHHPYLTVMINIDEIDDYRWIYGCADDRHQGREKFIPGAVGMKKRFPEEFCRAWRTAQACAP